MRRTLVTTILALTFLSMVGPSSAAHAAQPIHIRAGVEEFDLLIQGVCAFDVAVHVRQRLNVTLFVDRDGNVVRGSVTGPIVAWVTNLESRVTIRQVIPGPAFLDADQVIVRGTGPWAFLFTVEGHVINAWGHITFDEQGLVVGVRGRTESFCGALA
jgi:hypothetical protein